MGLKSDRIKKSIFSKSSRKTDRSKKAIVSNDVEEPVLQEYSNEDEIILADNNCETSEIVAERRKGIKIKIFLIGIAIAIFFYYGPIIDDDDRIPDQYWYISSFFAALGAVAGGYTRNIIWLIKSILCSALICAAVAAGESIPFIPLWLSLSLLIICFIGIVPLKMS